MGQNERDQVGKIVVYIIYCLIAYSIFMALLPYIEACLAVVGAAYVYYEYQKGKRR